MKVSVDWLRELLPGLKASPRAIRDRLTDAGLEVEGLELQADALAGMIVGEVRALAPHPGADKLQIATVFDGAEDLQIVCGAPNVAVGQKVALARVGVVLAGGLEIRPREIRGVASAGMLCSEKELGLSSEAAGVMVLPARSKAGKPLAPAIGRSDAILEVSPPANRPDVLSHFGLAREIAALFRLGPPKIKARVRESGVSASALAKVEIKAGPRCPRYLARVIEGVRVGPSPEAVVRRLEAIGLRSISNVVDATNLVLMELGHPLHAFDLDRLQEARIVVRTAKAGESIVTIDAVTRKLDEDDLVIADAQAPVALAGVMGGSGSEVSAGTTRILLESARFDPRSVRRTGKRHGLHTEASHRFERGADPEMLDLAIDRCAQRIVELAGGEIRPGLIEVVKKDRARRVVPIRPARAASVLGRPVDRDEVKETLAALGLKKVSAPKDEERRPRKEKGKKSRKQKPPADALFFEVPSHRVDLVAEVDLIEELARVAGYDTIPTTLPAFTPAIAAAAEDPAERVRDALVGLGFRETISLAFNSRAQLEQLGFNVQRAVEVANPLGEESALMRRSLLPALLRAVQHNQSLMRSDVRLFELGNCFEWASPPGQLPVETASLGLVLRGRRAPRGWWGDPSAADVYDLKGVLEALLDLHDVRGARFVAVERSHLHPRSSGEIEVGGRPIGVFGELHPDLVTRLDLAGPPVLVAELELEALLRARGPRALARPLPRFPAVARDLSFFLDRRVSAEAILDVVRGSGGGELESAEIFDVYEGKGVPEGKRSVAVSMAFRALERTLTDAEVDAVQTGVIQALEGHLGAEIRKGG
ncbi:MAG: phenylalanine--tRNA ligase subunit beta [Deltaproteobacteria bacterium]|nr:phenylalanine--tRNA ligase subunit beta [Deltaproteobacteria bacterium]